MHELNQNALNKLNLSKKLTVDCFYYKKININREKGEENC